MLKDFPMTKLVAASRLSQDASCREGVKELHEVRWQKS
jgi:hypothetical protein